MTIIDAINEHQLERMLTEDAVGILPRKVTWRTCLAKRVAKINRLIITPRTVKIATGYVALETVLGIPATIATATAFVALGHPFIAAGAVALYLCSVTVRYILARSALTHES